MAKPAGVMRELMGNPLSAFARDLRTRVQLSAPDPVRHALLPPLYSAREITRLLGSPSLPVYQWRGQGQGGPMTVTYAGIGFSKQFLRDHLFLEDPIEEEVGRVLFWRHEQLASLCPGDIQIIEATSRLICRLPRENAIILPEFVRHILDVRGDWLEVQNRFRRNTHRVHLRRVRRYGYEYDASHAGQDFDHFYRQMYLPTMEERHGEMSSPMSVSEARQLFRHGCLLRVMREGEWVSGVVCHPQGRTVIFDIVGVKDADVQLMRQGATSTLYYAAAHWANGQGYEAVNFLGTCPWLEMGDFRHKRQWGGTVCVPRELHRRIWFRVRRITPAVSQFLKENPVIVLDEQGDPHGLIVVDDPHTVSGETRARLNTRYVTPGLSSLLVRAVSSFAPGTDGTKVPDLVIPMPNRGLGTDDAVGRRS